MFKRSLGKSRIRQWFTRDCELCWLINSLNGLRNLGFYRRISQLKSQCQYRYLLGRSRAGDDLVSEFRRLFPGIVFQPANHTGALKTNCEGLQLSLQIWQGISLFSSMETTCSLIISIVLEQRWDTQMANSSRSEQQNEAHRLHRQFWTRLIKSLELDGNLSISTTASGVKSRTEKLTIGNWSTRWIFAEGVVLRIVICWLSCWYAIKSRYGCFQK